MSYAFNTLDAIASISVTGTVTTRLESDAEFRSRVKYVAYEGKLNCYAIDTFIGEELDAFAVNFNLKRRYV